MGGDLLLFLTHLMSNSGISRNLFLISRLSGFLQYLPRLEFLVIVDRSICQGWGSWWRGVHWCWLPWHWMMIIGLVHPPRFTDACAPNTPPIAHHRKCSEMQFIPMENPQKLIFSNAIYGSHALSLVGENLRKREGLHTCEIFHFELAGKGLLCTYGLETGQQRTITTRELFWCALYRSFYLAQGI